MSVSLCFIINLITISQVSKHHYTATMEKREFLFLHFQHNLVHLKSICCVDFLPIHLLIYIT